MDTVSHVENDAKTVTEVEVHDRELFDSIAEKYARKDMLPASRRARRLRLRQTLRAIPPIDCSDTLLEVGCGAGFSADYLKGTYGSFLGIDYSGKLIAFAREHIHVPHAEFDTVNVKEFESGRQFDVVFMIGVLHHVDDMDEAMRDMVKVLRPSGWLVANEPQPGNPLVQAARRMRKKVDRSYSEDQRTLSDEELRAIFERAGLVEIRIRSQGLFSTPFAEVTTNAQWLARPLSAIACGLDRVVESLAEPMLRHLSWNLIAAGRKLGE